MKKKVMIVDDDLTMNSLLKTLLELDGFVVVQAHRGDTVLPTALAEKPDAVLMDVHIAGANGMDLLREIRLQMPPLRPKRRQSLLRPEGVNYFELAGQFCTSNPYSLLL